MAPVTFGDDIAEGLEELRGHVATRRRSTVDIYRATGRAPLDVATLRQLTIWQKQPDVPARVKARQAGSQPVIIGGKTFPVATGVLEVHHAADIRDGDHFHVTAGESAGLVGRILAVPMVDQASGLRLPYAAAQYMPEWG